MFFFFLYVGQALPQGMVTTGLKYGKSTLQIFSIMEDLE